MADNLQVKDAAGATQTVRTTESGGVHTPHQNANLRVAGADVAVGNPVPVSFPSAPAVTISGEVEVKNDTGSPLSVAGTRANDGTASVTGSTHLTVGGQDGANLRPLLTDNGGRIVVSDLGAANASAAPADGTGNYSILSAIKRVLLNGAAMLASLAGITTRLDASITVDTFNKKLRDAFQTFPGTNWTIVSQGSGDLVLLDGNAAGAAYLVVSLDPLTAGTETRIESVATFSLPIEVAVGLHASQRTLGQEFAFELVSTETPAATPADIAISSISQATTTLSVTTATAHGLRVGQRIGIAGVTGDSRLNYPSLVVATTPSSTTFTATAGPGGNLPSLTIGPFTAGAVYQRSAMGYAPNGTALLLENAQATNATFYAKAEGGDALPIGGTLAGNHSVAINTTASVQAVNAALNYAFRPTTEYRLSAMADRLQWSDVPVDQTGQSTNRANITQVVPSPDVSYKLRFRAANNKSLSLPVAQIQQAAKTGTTTATVTTATPHGLTTGDLINLYGTRDNTNFPTVSVATAVASVVDTTTFTVVWGGAVTATTFGGFVARVNGGQNLQGTQANHVQTATRTSNVLTLVGAVAWSGYLIGDYVNVIGVRDNSTGATLGVDGTYRVRDIQTTSLILEPIGSAPTGGDIVTTNCGGAVIRRTDYRISFVRLFDFERVRVEPLARPVSDLAAAFPVTVNNSPAVTVSSGTVTTVSTVSAVTSVAALTLGNLGFPSIQADVASAALTTTTTTAAIAPTFGTTYEVNVPVTAVTGTTPTLDIGIEESDDSGANWFRVYDFPRITATGMYRSPKLPMTGNRVRYVQTVGGTTPSFTRAINRLQNSDVVDPVRQLIDRTQVPNTLNSATPSLDIRNCRNVQLVLNTGAITTSAQSVQLEGSDDNGATWYALGTPLTGVASSTVQTTVANVHAGLLRARVSTAGVGVTAGYSLIKGF